MAEMNALINPMTLPEPYYCDSHVTLYCGDCREIMPLLPPMDCIITDPVWPHAKAQIPGCDRPFELLREALEVAPDVVRVILQFGCDSDPRILAAVPKRYPFFRVCWLEYACPTRKGRLLYTGDVAYVFGTPPKSAPGRRVMSGRYISTIPDVQRSRLKLHKEYGNAVKGCHPCPRRLQHVQWLTGRWVDGVVLDCFAGSGTTLLAAKQSGRKCVGIEICEEYCAIAVERLRQEVLGI